MTSKRPTSDECTANAIIVENEHGVRIATWHPQWGGYVGRCLVEFERVTGCEGRHGCFAVTNWHDGEFPIKDDGEPDHKHHCDAAQVVDFGLFVLEQQVQYQRSEGGGPVLVDAAWIDRTIERLKVLNGKGRQ